jgi:uncharacterized membrane protein YphA (DoxX/SURF4 family)
MKAAITITRILVGVLFIFSGLVKANDPHGLSYKMQEFFEVWGVHGFDSWTLLLSVLMNAFEIIAGFALLLGWRIKLFIWLLLLLILFFTFLTGYTYITGKPTNCGCFGDCLPITAKTSFLKDVALTLMIGFLFWQQRFIKPLFSNRSNTWLMLGITVFSFGIQWYALNYLPVVDCLPFKKGKNITTQMKMPANAVPDVTEIRFVYEKDGKQVEFTADQFPKDFNSSYKFINRYDKLIKKGKNNEPPIKGFSLKGSYYKDTASGEEIINDSTAIVLAKPWSILLFCEDMTTSVGGWKKSFDEIYASANARNIPVYAVSTTRDSAIQIFQQNGWTNMQVFNCDRTAIRTAARTNPCLYLLQEGTIIGKWSAKTMRNVMTKLTDLPAQTTPKP